MPFSLYAVSGLSPLRSSVFLSLPFEIREVVSDGITVGRATLRLHYSDCRAAELIGSVKWLHSSEAGRAGHECSLIVARCTGRELANHKEKEALGTGSCKCLHIWDETGWKKLRNPPSSFQAAKSNPALPWGWNARGVQRCSLGLSGLECLELPRVPELFGSQGRLRRYIYLPFHLQRECLPSFTPLLLLTLLTSLSDY